MEAFPGWVGRYATDGTFLEANQAVFRAQGAGGPAAWKGLKLWELPQWGASPELTAQARAAFERALGGERVRFEARMSSPAGVVECDVTFSPLVDAGVVVGVATFGVDVSSERRSREALEVSERRFRDLVESAADGIFVADPQGRYLEVNAQGCAMVGYSREEILGMRMRELLAPDESNPQMPRGSRVRGRRRLRRKDGTEVPVEIIGVELPDGNILGIARDVSETDRVENALREREEELGALSDATIEALFVHQGGRILATNRAARELYRLPPDGALGELLMDYIAPESRELIQGRIRAASRDPYEATAMRSDGTVFPAAVQARTINFRGQPARLAAVRDLTEMRRLQASVAFSDRMASVGTLAAGVAHEINNPLTLITAGLEWVVAQLQSGPVEPENLAEVLDTLRDAQEGAHRVATIVRDLRTFSRTEDEAPGPVSLGPVLLYATRMVAADLRLRARLTTEIADLPPVLGSQTRIGQVFLNLIVNAVQAIEPGAAEANTIALTARVEGPRVVVSVSDTGKGIEPSVIGRIFEPFFTTKAQGSGIGLAISHGIVTQLGGTIEVESTPGQGSTFRVSLPIASTPALETSTAASPAPEPLSAGRLRVLVVDDEHTLLRVAERTLKKEFEVTLASHAREAVRLLEGGAHFDVVLCDLLMPEMTGIDLFGELQRRWPEVARRVVFVTGGVFTTDAASFLERSGQPQLDKPFSRETVRVAVGKLTATS